MSIMKITGVKQSTGTYEGNHYDYSVVYCVTSLDPTNPACNGFAGIELRGKPDIYEKYGNGSGFKFKPEGVEFDVRIDTVATGKGQFRDLVTSMTPIQSAPAARPAPAVPPAPAKAT